MSFTKRVFKSFSQLAVPPPPALLEHKHVINVLLFFRPPSLPSFAFSPPDHLFADKGLSGFIFTTLLPTPPRTLFQLLHSLLNCRPSPEFQVDLILSINLLQANFENFRSSDPFFVLLTFFRFNITLTVQMILPGCDRYLSSSLTPHQDTLILNLFHGTYKIGVLLPPILTLGRRSIWCFSFYPPSSFPYHFPLFKCWKILLWIPFFDGFLVSPPKGWCSSCAQ